MAVRAKFRLNSYTTEMYNTYPHKVDVTDAKGTVVATRADTSRLVPVEKRTLNFTPVYSDDPDSENRKFWDATPSGSLQLGVVNQDAWGLFDLGKSYYLDFTEAPE